MGSITQQLFNFLRNLVPDLKPTTSTLGVFLVLLWLPILFVFGFELGRFCLGKIWNLVTIWRTTSIRLFVWFWNLETVWWTVFILLIVRFRCLNWRFVLGKFWLVFRQIQFFRVLQIILDVFCVIKRQSFIKFILVSMKWIFKLKF